MKKCISDFWNKIGGFRGLTYVYIILYGMICLFVVFHMKFYVALNDFWGTFWIAKHLIWSNPASFYNGFHPIGFPAFLRLLSILFPDPLPPALFANIGFSLLALVGLSHLGAIILQDRRWTFICVVCTSLYSPFFKHTVMPGADIGAVAFSTMGLVTLINSVLDNTSLKHSTGKAFMAGLLFGMAAIWRYYGLALGISLTIGMTLVAFWDRRILPHVALMVLGLFSIYSTQMVCNVLSEHGLFETNTAFNVYITINGINWWRLPQIPHSLTEVIFSQPVAFFKTYFHSLLGYLMFLLVIIANLFFCKEKGFNQVRSVILLGCFFFLGILSLGASSRGILLIVPLLAVEGFMVLKFVFGFLRDQWHRRQIAVITGCFLLVVIFSLRISSSLGRDISFVIAGRKATVRDNAIEEVLLQEGVSYPRQVFVTDFNLYFRGPLKYRPYHNGGWFKYDLWGYLARYPDLNVESIAQFLRDCHKQGITHVVLDHSSQNLSKDLFHMYTGSLQTPKFVMLANINGSKVYSICTDEERL